VIGLNSPLVFSGDPTKDFFVNFFKQSGPLSNFLGRIPIINAIGDLHDTYWNSVGMPPLPPSYLDGLIHFGVGNVPSMVPAAVTTVGALLNGIPVEAIDRIKR
jgi:hypothetical protein